MEESRMLLKTIFSMKFRFFGFVNYSGGLVLFLALFLVLVLVLFLVLVLVLDRYSISQEI